MTKYEAIVAIEFSANDTLEARNILTFLLTKLKGLPTVTQTFPIDLMESNGTNDKE